MCKIPLLLGTTGCSDLLVIAYMSQVESTDILHFMTYNYTDIYNYTIV